MGVTTLRLATFLLACSSLTGCAVLLDEPRPGRLLPDGSLLLGSGTVNGELWTHSLQQQRGHVCAVVLVGGRSDGNDICFEAVGFQRSLPTVDAIATDATTRIDGFSLQPAVAVRIDIDGLVSEHPVVSLAPLGLPGVGFGVIVGPARNVDAVFLDAAGGQVERHVLEARRLPR